MGEISFLTSGSSGGSKSISNSIADLEDCSIIFCAAWNQKPPDLQRAGRVSLPAMEHLDHIVSEIMRARDSLKSINTYDGSPLSVELGKSAGLIHTPTNRIEQSAMINAGAGNGRLPSAGVPISMERLLNKIKHRHHGPINFRVSGNSHTLIFNVDKPDQTPDCIVEFEVKEFCRNLAAIPSLI